MKSEFTNLVQEKIYWQQKKRGSLVVVFALKSIPPIVETD